MVHEHNLVDEKELDNAGKLGYMSLMVGEYTNYDVKNNGLNNGIVVLAMTMFLRPEEFSKKEVSFVRNEIRKYSETGGFSWSLGFDTEPPDGGPSFFDFTSLN
ncbi:MAG: hypothetical protein DKM50_04340 [Candidatus Margulisiibacteriota bacterium]|nr:MAG: hypothetical protein A2X42_05705 [Candidatus Margulisbacteria bacterium GWF2_38_17]PZM82110.1 MAG: hypothetical protein DKM50_04340 [Candidatus Margulisiibacteriota bacterium]HAR63631.1 hypothetical protein [Candidatus Margulisiibacteriota bacterium]HCT84375.1 hypothetical protein [Candidatus Margulisiibacteriota bacterium]